MVSVMVEQFREMQLALAGTIEQYETPEFKALDSRIASTFDAIYRHEPRTIGEARTLVHLFLELIENNDAGDSIHLIERVRTIIDDCAGSCPPSMEIVYGAGI
ncbi:MAG TPA: hypothetical protein VGN93_17260 [Shinella sp.]|jgi:hypothetical protein|uniref:hypothetical protein n=1 Tax=Shinella sp. TaxID=1870904 RepID=UPI0029BD202A|nr:hypothetical protein [Shinella sp.]MDX3977305.1 hypothetical protein [Shinella sp.]HEV7248728.1 hypothetical protein [Shinella sp.]